MHLKVFGNNASCPEADGACSCYTVHGEDFRLVIELGNGGIAKLQKEMDIACVDGIIISHLHFDHFADLICAKYQLESRKANGETIKPIPLLIPQLPKWARRELESNEIFQIKFLFDHCVFHFNHVSLEFIKMAHLVETYGLRLQAEGKVFAYSADTGQCPQLRELASNADLFLCEASYAEVDREEKHHISSATAATVARASKVKTLLLTHYKTIDNQFLLETARSIFPEVNLSRIGDDYEI